MWTRRVLLDVTATPYIPTLFFAKNQPKEGHCSSTILHFRCSVADIFGMQGHIDLYRSSAPLPEVPKPADWLLSAHLKPQVSDSDPDYGDDTDDDSP